MKTIKRIPAQLDMKATNNPVTPMYKPKTNEVPMDIDAEHVLSSDELDEPEHKNLTELERAIFSLGCP